MEENNIILNEDFKSIILNKKVNARIMSLSEIIDNMISIGIDNAYHNEY